MEEAEEKSIKDEISKMTFEEIQKLKERLGSKVYKEAVYGTKSVKERDFKRANKNRPREVSSKKKPGPSVVVEVKKIERRDPRFDALCGSYNESVFKKDYSFLDDIRKDEEKALKEQLKSEKDPNEVQRIKFLLQRIQNQQREEERKQKKLAKKQEERSEVLNSLKEGKKPYFKTKYEKKIGNLISQYTELRESGKLTKHIEKQKKKNIAKEKKSRYFNNDEEGF